MTPVAVQTAVMEDCPKGTVIFAESQDGTYYAQSKGGKVFCISADGDVCEKDGIGMNTGIIVDGAEVSLPFDSEARRYYLQGQAKRIETNERYREQSLAIKAKNAEDVAMLEGVMRRIASEGKTDCVEILRDALAETQFAIVDRIMAINIGVR